MTEPAITPELVAKHNLTPEEFAHAKEILGRVPTYTELGIFSVMWSEHCSYKNTKPLLKTFPTKSPKILVGAGEENAGIIDIGDGIAIAFKIESHNHPSAVEPFQGATTGVGGIVINGIAHYGNCFGIPTIAGEVYFDKTYAGNPLVNAFCLGVLRHEQITRGAAKGVGNPVFYVGPATGRDGLAGAAFASQDLTEESAEQQRGAVQVGDPFMEKLVCEACLELLATGAVAGMQDMGAAGLTCSTCEMAARAGTGIEIELDKVPQRAANMSSYELMLSESQERMLIVVHKGREEEVKRIFDKWDLPWAEIGIITDTGHMKVRHGGKLVVDIPAKKIADESPVYHREAVEPAYIKEVQAFRLDGIADTTAPADVLKKLLAFPSIASKNWVYRQYDHQVRDGSVVLPGSDAAVIRIKTDSLPVMSAELAAKVGDATVSEKLIAMTVDCNGGYVYLDPYEGAKAAVAEACRNLACSGALPLGATDNLNMPSPLKPELFWQIKESVRGLAEGCKAFNAPVTGGNCSLYNQSPSGPIDPTPTISVVGLIEKLEHVTTQWFKDEGDAIILLGDAVEATPVQGLGGSAYLQVIHGKKAGAPPRCDLEVAKTLHTTLIGLIQSGLVKSAHDCSEGGLAVALAESCISQLIARDTPRLIGAMTDLSGVAASRQSAADSSGEKNAALSRDAATVRSDALLFGETQSRVVISCKALDAVKVVERAKLMGVPAAQIGKVGGDKLTVKTASGEFSAPLAELHDAWWYSIARAMA